MFFRAVSGGTVRASRDTPERALSARCACAADGRLADNAINEQTSIVAGECGNRTHPARPGRVTPVLKTGEATRPHPPPCSVNHNRKSVSLRYFADLNRSVHTRKIL